MIGGWWLVVGDSMGGGTTQIGGALHSAFAAKTVVAARKLFSGMSSGETRRPWAYGVFFHAPPIGLSSGAKNLQVLVCNPLLASGKSVSTVGLRCGIRERSRSLLRRALFASRTNP